MKVDYYHQRENIYGNIMWDKELGQSDETHPIKSMPTKNGEHPIETFTNLGYFASCFPEGDGIVIQDKSNTKTAGMVADDIIKCFGWDVCIKADTANRVAGDL